MATAHHPPDPAHLPRHKGSYVLLMALARPATLKVGRLGSFKADAGLYAYTGSAHGPGGLAARVGRHLRASKRRHWHVDYLRQHAPVVAVWAGWGPSAAGRLDECGLCARLARQPFLRQPIKGFGSSDCGCLSHLFYWPISVAGETEDRPGLLTAIACLGKTLSPLQRL